MSTCMSEHVRSAGNFLMTCKACGDRAVGTGRALQAFLLRSLIRRSPPPPSSSTSSTSTSTLLEVLMKSFSRWSAHHVLKNPFFISAAQARKMKARKRTTASLPAGAARCTALGEGRPGSSYGMGWILLAALMQVCLLPGVPAGSTGNSEDFVQMLLVRDPRVPPNIMHAALWGMQSWLEPVAWPVAAHDSSMRATKPAGRRRYWPRVARRPVAPRAGE